MKKINKCIFCNNNKFKKRFNYTKPVPREIKLKIDYEKYSRYYKSCKICGHWFSVIKVNLNNLYNKEYVASTYGDKLNQTFKKIVSLPKSKSDNYFRVKRILNFSKNFFKKKKKYKLLDVGSGLGVFPYEMKKKGLNCTALDPDKNASNHIKNKLKIKTKNIDFFKSKFNQKFNIITLNKVLEHVENPPKMLRKIKNNLIKKENFFYIEVPDATEASKINKEREEFAIDHLHVFTLNSLYLLIKNCNFTPILIERIKENSNKFTLIAFGKF